MTIIDFLKHIGIAPQTFIAGMSGAVVFLTKSKDMTRTQQFLTVLSGGLSANYLTPVVANWLNLNPSVLYGIAFLLGYSGMKSVEAILVKFQDRLISKNQVKDEDN